jgi:hypothetical protein
MSYDPKAAGKTDKPARSPKSNTSPADGMVAQPANFVDAFIAFREGARPAQVPYVWSPGPGATLPDLSADAPRQVLAYARSKAGKSFVLEFIAENAMEAGLQLLLGDLDRDNASLSKRFPGKTIRPPNATDAYFDRTLIDMHNFQLKYRNDILLDVGFGSIKTFRTFAQKMGLQRIQEEAGVRGVLLIPLTPDLDDIMPIELLSGVYLPKDIVLVVNEGLIDTDRDVALEFEEALHDRRILALIERGARLVHLPRLPKSVAFRNTLKPFAWAARSGWDNPLDMFERAGAGVFLETARRRFQEVADVIPFPKRSAD